MYDSFGARYYASQLGRFMTPDWSDSPQPIPFANLTNPQSLNLYSYVLNNPASDVDPDGHLLCFLGLFCNDKSKLPVKEGVAAGTATAGTADGMVGGIDTDAILAGLQTTADAVTEAGGAILGAASGVAAALLTFSQPLNPGEDQFMARVHAQSSAAQKKLGNLAGRAGDKIRDVIRSRGGTASNVNEAGHWADRTLGEAAQAAASGDRSAEKAIKIAKDAARPGQKN